MASALPHLPGPNDVNPVLGDLRAHSLSVRPDTVGREIASMFEMNMNLPGILIRDRKRLLGMVSRDRFQSRLSRKFGIEVAANRPILSLFDHAFDLAHTPMLTLPEDSPIQNAVEACLQRNEEMAYEPVIIVRSDQPPGLVDFHSLLLAQTRLLASLTRRAEEQKRLADEANRTKSNFLTHMSHELRTPLTAILGYTEIMQEDLDEQVFDDFPERLSHVHQAGSHLLTIINSLLDISKIEAGHLDLFLETTPIRTVLEEACSAVGPQIERNNNSLELICPDEAGEMITDHTKVRQNLINLLSNAAKFTRDGTIRVSVETLKVQSGDWIYFRIKDSGIGMTREQIDRIFQPFVQADSSTTRRFGGTGLGLALTRRFCQILGGEIDVESEPDAGTCFTMRLPRHSSDGRSEKSLH